MNTGRSGSGFANWTMRIAAVLFCLVLVSTHLVSGIFARYIATDSGSDGARVAKFRITEKVMHADSASQFTSVSAGLVPNVPCRINVEVVNDSEVAVFYEITADNLTDNLPLKFYGLDETPASLAVVAEAAELAALPYVYSDEMEPNAARTYYMYVIWTPVDEAEALAHMGEVDMITLELSASQID